MTPGYRALLSIRDYRILFAVSSLQTASTTAASLALATGLQQSTGSPLLTALGMFASPLAAVIGANTLLAAADTVPPRTLLRVIYLLIAACLAVQTMPGLSPVARLAPMLIIGAASAVAAGARWGLLGDLLSPIQYAPGRSLINSSVGALQIAGFAGGGALLLAFTVDTVFWVAAACSALAAALTLGLPAHAARRTGRLALLSSWRANLRLLGDGRIRRLIIAASVPNGLIVGCEALFVPWANARASVLYLAGAFGMMLGDIVLGRLFSPARRARLQLPLRVLLAGSFLIFAASPTLVVAAIAVGIGSIGYAATLALQEGLLRATPHHLLGQAQGLENALRMTAQGVGAVLGGSLAEFIGPGPAIVALAATSLAITTTVTRRPLADLPPT